MPQRIHSQLHFMVSEGVFCPSAGSGCLHKVLKYSYLNFKIEISMFFDKNNVSKQK